VFRAQELGQVFPGLCPQIGVIEDTDNRPRLSKLLRFYSSSSPENLTSLEEYVGRMKEGQKGIFYMVGGCGRGRERVK